MKVILHTTSASPHGVYHPGEHDLPDDLAQALVASGHAEPTEAVAKVVTTTSKKAKANRSKED